MKAKKQNHVGRPGDEQYIGVDRRPIMTQWPKELIAAIDAHVGLGNRTRWLIEAAREKLDRETGK